jgi:hypothetical protein
MFGTVIPVRIPGKRVRQFDLSIKPVTSLKDKMCFWYQGRGLTSAKGTGDLKVCIRPVLPFNPQAASRHREALLEVFGGDL